MPPGPPEPDSLGPSGEATTGSRQESAEEAALLDAQARRWEQLRGDRGPPGRAAKLPAELTPKLPSEGRRIPGFVPPVVVQPNRRSRWGWPTRLALVLSIVVLVGAGDWYLRNREFDVLLGRIQVSETAMLASDAAAAALAKEAVIDDAEDYQGWVEEGKDLASHWGEELFVARDRIESARIMPWHFAAAKAKDRYLDHVAEWEDLLEDAARDPKTAAERRPKIGGTFRVAIRALRKAVPIWPVEDFARRISRIEKEGG